MQKDKVLTDLIQVWLCWDRIASPMVTITGSQCRRHQDQKRQEIYVFPEYVLWIFSLKNGNYSPLSNLWSHLQVAVPHCSGEVAVGIFVQYEKRLIFFYSVNDLTILYMFETNFTQTLKPHFFSGPPIKMNITALPFSKCLQQILFSIPRLQLNYHKVSSSQTMAPDGHLSSRMPPVR